MTFDSGEEIRDRTFRYVALREAREPVFWLRLWAVLRPASALQLAALQDEGERIACVLAAIVVEAKRQS